MARFTRMCAGQGGGFYVIGEEGASNNGGGGGASAVPEKTLSTEGLGACSATYCATF